MNQEQLFNLLALGVRRGASDVHFEAGYPPAYRFTGELMAARVDALTSVQTEGIARLVLPKDDPFLTGAVKDVDRSFSVQGLARFRVNLFRQRGSMGLVMRVIPFEIPSFEKLQLPSVLMSLTGLRHGLVLITGATGNGKSTTIASILDAMNRSQRLHIVTIEDPIEFLYAPAKSVVVQREVGADTQSFATALKAALRQDPDVIMLGEMRDRDTAEIAINAAETGHLVLTSLHTQDVPRTITRLTGMFGTDESGPLRTRLAECLKAVVSLRLLTRADNSGLVPAVEVMLMTRTIQEHIRAGGAAEELLQHMARSHGDLKMQTFDQHLLQLCKAGLISAETARGHASNPSDFERILMLEGPAAPQGEVSF